MSTMTISIFVEDAADQAEAVREFEALGITVVEQHSSTQVGDWVLSAEHEHLLTEWAQQNGFESDQYEIS